MILGREPAAIAAFLAIAINLAITFGLRLTVEQVALINTLVVAGLGLIVRQVVTPTANPQLKQGTEVEVITPGPTANLTKTL
jgi:hypothetical protein